jgi:hypothetical protein
MDFTNDLFDILITLKGDVTEQRSIPVDKPLAGPCVSRPD